LDRNEPYFDIHEVLQTFGTFKDGGCGPKLHQWSRKTLEENAALLVHLDESGRAGEGSKLIRYRLAVTSAGLRGFLWDTKEAPGRLTAVRAAHCHEEYKEEWCSPCVVNEILRRTEGFKMAEDIDCSPHLNKKTTGLFLSTFPKDKLYRSLGSNAVANRVIAPLQRAGVHTGWTAHKVRGLGPCKAINMGWPWAASLLKGRWSPTADTFKKSYFRRTLYKETSPDNANLSWEVVIRLKETRLV
jgi:hypothetical protein